MFVIMNVGTEWLYKKPGHYVAANYATERGAKTACTKLNKSYGSTAQWVVMTRDTFEQNHNPMVERTNLLSGKTYMEKRNTPACCSPSTETYWSM